MLDLLDGILALEIHSHLKKDLMKKVKSKFFKLLKDIHGDDMSIIRTFVS